MRKILSLFLCLMMMASTVFIFPITAIAETATIVSASGSSATYDFENGIDYLSVAADWNTASANVEILTENNNSYLAMTAQGWKHMILTFPFELQGGQSYTLSYKYKMAVGSEKINEGETRGGIRLGKNSGTTSADKKFGISDHVGTYLSTISGGSAGDYKTLSSDAWQEVSQTISVPANSVTTDFKYLAFDYYPAYSTNDTYYTIYFDDISISLDMVTEDDFTLDFESEYTDSNGVIYYDPNENFNWSTNNDSTRAHQAELATEASGNHAVRLTYTTKHNTKNYKENPAFNIYNPAT